MEHAAALLLPEWPAALCRWLTVMNMLAQAESRLLSYALQSNGPGSWDEVMVVAYKSRWQFFHMLLTPSYWPLA
jgi:hypothetical protein